MLGVSMSEPMPTCTYAPPRTTENRNAPHNAQRVSLRASSPTTRSLSAPSVTSSFSRSMPASDLKADPVEARQREQWQFHAYSNSSGTRYRTAPHQQPPRSITAIQSLCACQMI
jgi:hypothetical protein